MTLGFLAPAYIQWTQLTHFILHVICITSHIFISILYWSIANLHSSLFDKDATSWDIYSGVNEHLINLILLGIEVILGRMCVTNWRSWVPKKSMENSLGTNLAMDLDDEDSGVDEDFESLVEDNEDIVERGAIDSQIEPLLSSSQVGSLMHPRPHRRRSVHRRSSWASQIRTSKNPFSISLYSSIFTQFLRWLYIQDSTVYVALIWLLFYAVYVTIIHSLFGVDYPYEFWSDYLDLPNLIQKSGYIIGTIKYVGALCAVFTVYTCCYMVGVVCHEARHRVLIFLRET